MSVAEVGNLLDWQEQHPVQTFSIFPPTPQNGGTCWTAGCSLHTVRCQLVLGSQVWVSNVLFNEPGGQHDITKPGRVWGWEVLYHLGQWYVCVTTNDSNKHKLKWYHYKKNFPVVKAGGYTKMKYFRDSFVYIRHQLAFPTRGNAKTL